VIVLLLSGVGLPMETVWNGEDAPTRKKSRRYESTTDVPSVLVAL
jgi:hypothetical protein